MVKLSTLEAIRERCNIKYWQRQLLDNLKAEKVPFDEKLHNPAYLHVRTQSYSKDAESNDKNGFFIETYDGEQWGKEENKTTILSFKEKYTELVNCLVPFSEYKIVGCFSRKVTKGAVFYNFLALRSIELNSTSGLDRARERFNAEKQKGEELSANNWSRKLSTRELQEQEKEKKSLLNRIDLYTENQKYAKYVFDQIEPKQRKLSKIIKALRQLKVRPSSYFPNSMTFVQNPHYQGIHNSYKKIRDITNLADDELLISLEEIDNIGLVNMPLLYERWCLLQIIAILRETFRFIPQSNWKYQLAIL